MFNMLESLGGVTAARVVDLFAGSGALGIEALSRGASSAVFVDHDRAAVASVRTNLAAAGVADRARVTHAEVVRWLGHAPAVDVVLCDPPYDWDQWDALLPGIHAILPAAGGLAVLESGKELDLGGGWQVLTAKRYGGSVVTVARPAAKGGM